MVREKAVRVSQRPDLVFQEVLTAGLGLDPMGTGRVLLREGLAALVVSLDSLRACVRKAS